MTVAFVLTIETSDTDLISQADEIRSILDGADYNVLSIHPWARPSLPLPKTQQQNQKP